MRRSGRTTRAIQALAYGGLYVVPNHCMGSCIRQLAEEIGRADIKIVALSTHTPGALRGRTYPDMAVDHTVFEPEFGGPRDNEKLNDIALSVRRINPPKRKQVRIPSAVPRAIQELVDSVPKLHVRQEINAEFFGGSKGPPRHYVERDSVGRIAQDLAPFVDHEWDHDFTTYRDILTSSIAKPLNRLELTSLLSRAYEAGRQSR